MSSAVYGPPPLLVRHETYDSTRHPRSPRRRYQQIPNIPLPAQQLPPA
jgi:hypothetical protein